jgi:hypothetical protein
MDELTRFCTACQAEKEIVSIVKDAGGSVTKMSCGHSHVTEVITDTIRLFDRVDDQVKRDGKTIAKGMSRSKPSVTTKRITRESLNFNWNSRTKHHKVEELQDDGTWKVEHEEAVPFETKKPK